MTDLKLLPCPFCGGKPILVNKTADLGEESYYKHVKCYDCEAESGWFVDETKALELWNKRHASELEKIKKICCARTRCEGCSLGDQEYVCYFYDRTPCFWDLYEINKILDPSREEVKE